MKKIFEYIAFELLTPDAARGQVKRIMDSVDKLDGMPMMYKIYEDEPWKSKGLRVFPVDNYIILYLPKEDLQTVNVVRIIYGGRDINKQLEETKEILGQD